MKRLAIAFAVLSAVGATGLGPDTRGHARRACHEEPTAVDFLDDLKPTTDMWFYEQAMRQYQDPKVAVRKAAEARGRPAPAATGGHGAGSDFPTRVREPTPTRSTASIRRRWASNNYLLPVPLDRRRRRGGRRHIQSPARYSR